MNTPPQTTIPCRSHHKKYPENGARKSEGDEKKTVRLQRWREREMRDLMNEREKPDI